ALSFSSSQSGLKRLGILFRQTPEAFPAEVLAIIQRKYTFETPDLVPRHLPNAVGCVKLFQLLLARVSECELYGDSGAVCSLHAEIHDAALDDVIGRNGNCRDDLNLSCSRERQREEWREDGEGAH